MFRFRLTISLALLGSTLTGCGSSRSVTVMVSRDGPTGPVPVSGAYVQLIPLDTSEVPLPVDPQTIDNLLNAIAVTGFTNENGIARFSLDSKLPHDVAVSPGALDKSAGAAETGKPTWRGRIDTSGQLTPLVDWVEPSTLRVSLTDH